MNRVRVMSHPKSREAVRAFSGHLPAAEQLWIERPLWQMQEESFPIDVLLPAIVVAPRPSRMIEIDGRGHPADLAERAAGNQLRSANVLAVTAALSARLNHPFLGAGEIKRPVGRGDVDAHRLFHIDVFSCGQRGQKNRRVTEIRRGDGHGIDFGQRQEVRETRELFRPLPQALLHSGTRRLAILFPDVADGDDLHAFCFAALAKISCVCADARSPEPMMPMPMRSLAPALDCARAIQLPVASAALPGHCLERFGGWRKAGYS